MARRNTVIDCIVGADLAETSKSAYLSRLHTLEQLFNKPVLAIIRDADRSIGMIRASYDVETTRKGMFAAILACFRHCESLKSSMPEEIRLKWFEAFKADDTAVSARYKRNEPTERQLSGYVPFEDIVKARDRLPRGSDERLLLSFYTYIHPLRADYGSVRLYNNAPPMQGCEANYIVMSARGCTLVLNEYKTSKKHGTFVKQLPVELCNELHASLKMRPRQYLFVMANGQPYALSNTYTRFANRTFQAIFNKPLTISLIRHSFISTLDFNKMTIEEKEQIAKEMLHTPRLQDEYRLLF